MEEFSNLAFRDSRCEDDDWNIQFDEMMDRLSLAVARAIASQDYKIWPLKTRKRLEIAA